MNPEGFQGIKLRALRKIYTSAGSYERQTGRRAKTYQSGLFNFPIFGLKELTSISFLVFLDNSNSLPIMMVLSDF
jgi:hypothetical protein